MNTKQPKQRLRSKRLVEACITTQSCYRMYKATCEKERRCKLPLYNNFYYFLVFTCLFYSVRMYNEKKHIAERLLISEKDYFKDLNLLLSVCICISIVFVTELVLEFLRSSHC